MTKLEIGSTVLAGTDVIEYSKIRKYPTITNLYYLLDDIKQIDVLGFFLSVSTGIVNVPIPEISEIGISGSGIATGFDGQGMLIVENNKISVKAPNNFLWGSSVAYTHVIKTEDGLSIVENNETIKSISAGNINNNTIPHDIVPSEDIVAWYKKADIGDKLVIEYGLSNFSDRRNPLSPTEVKYFFGEDIYEYLVSHPLNTPIILYMGDYKEKSGEDYYTYLGSYPEYNDAIRAYNAKQFVVAWNNTIIPPGSISSGKDTIYFESSRDPKAPGGGASHGVCPSARALRAAILSHGFPLPTGMNWDHDAINYGFNPATGIKVTNNGDTPVKIVMWTEGEGTSMVIYSKIIEYVPN